MTTAIQTTLDRQFRALAPRALKNGRAFAASVALTDGVSVQFQYRAPRKRKGAILADQTCLTVTYNEGRDLYDVKIEAVDGITLDVSTLQQIAGLDVEGFANLTA